MRKNIYDLVVAYRIYPKISRSPPIFKTDKYNLAKLCLESFKKSLGNLKVKIFALLDNCPPRYENLFKNLFTEKNLEIIRYDGIGNKETFVKQIKILIEQNDSDLVYFAEDDYFYLPNQIKKMLFFLKKNPKVHFITPYDHKDYYCLIFHDYKVDLEISANKHWRTVSSSCLSFLTSKEVLYKTKNVLIKYSYNSNLFRDRMDIKNSILKKIFKNFLLDTSDADIWISLTKVNVFKIFKIIKFKFQNRRIYKIYYRAWRYNWKQILFGRKWKLWAPIPSIATHMEEEFLSPSINWQKFFKELSNEMNLKITN